MSKPKNLIPLHEFANEIYKDLSKLMIQHPYGVMLSELQTYYGESKHRVLQATDLLEKVGKAVINQNGNGSYFILPFDQQDLLPIAKLSDLQREVLAFLVQICVKHQTRQVKSSYFQLARILGCSFGGLSTTLARLEALKYLKIKVPSTQGHQNELLLEIDCNICDDVRFQTYKQSSRWRKE